VTRVTTARVISQMWVLILYYNIFMIYSAVLEILVILGDIGPFLRPDLGEKLGGCYQLQIYINHRVLEAMGRFKQVYAEYFPSQSHFYAGKLLRRAPLWAISGSFVHPILVPSVLLGSRDLVEQDQISL
jgi:hypothetical protein